jgi:multiple sugar transport system substrate-binding protein
MWIRGSRAYAALLAAAALAGCSGLSPEAGESAGTRPVQIRHCFFGSYEEWQLWQLMAREFERTNPDVRVKLEYWPGNQYEDKLKLSMAGGVAPDLMAVQDEPFPAYCARGQFEDLTPYVEAQAAAFAPGRFFKTALETFRYQGRAYALPWNGGEVMIYYNRKLFREAGLPPPAPDWTWDQFLAAAQRLTRDRDGDGRLDQFGFELPGVPIALGWMNLLPWIWGAGGDLLDPAMTRCTLAEPAAIRGMQFIHDLRFRHHVAPATTEFSGTGGGVLFMTGRLGMMADGVWRLTFMRQTDLDWDVARMPRGPAGRFSRGTWDGLAIYRGSRHKPEAWRFMQYVLGERGQYHVASSGRALPPRRSQAYAEGFLRRDTPQHEELFIEGMEDFRTQRIHGRWAEMAVIVSAEMEKLLLGRATPEETGRAVQAQVDPLLR